MASVIITPKNIAVLGFTRVQDSEWNPEVDGNVGRYEYVTPDAFRVCRIDGGKWLIFTPQGFKNWRTWTVSSLARAARSIELIRQAEAEGRRI